MNGDTVAKVGLKMDAQQNAADEKHNNTKDDKTH
jgi:cell volume regulation protein A